jgi:hypothetical protein
MAMGEAMKFNLTAQCIVRNEPLVYYAVKSVYDYVDSILLWDTGSDDTNTLEDISRLLSKDVDHKIHFKTMSLPDESVVTWREANHRPLHKGSLSGVALARQQQMDATKTKFFMIVDGDEVHYRDEMATIVNDILPNTADETVAWRQPIMGYHSLNMTHFCTPFSVRLYRTDALRVEGLFPNEYYLCKDAGQKLKELVGTRRMMDISVRPYAHFELYLKPWRRQVKHPRHPCQPLPEVMLEDDFYWKRFEEAGKCKHST